MALHITNSPLANSLAIQPVVEPGDALHIANLILIFISDAVQ